MKQICRRAGYGLVFLSVLWAALLTGCQSAPHYGPLPADVPGPNENVGTSAKFRVGDQVLLNFSGSVGMDQPLQVHREAVKDNGTITPPLIGAVVALGKTPGELQTELQQKYARFYKNFIVTVIAADRYYYVSGEVRKPGPEPYLGETDIVKAISAAGDFTDFANKRKVRLTHSDGQREVINVQRILDGKADVVPIYPGDNIVVPRRLF